MNKKLEEIAKDQNPKNEIRGLGVALSRHYDFNGLDILKTLSYALEDCNYHHENSIICSMIESLEK